MNRKYYKVVDRFQQTNHYCSCRMHEKDIECFYHLNEWTYPLVKGSKLMVFDSLSHAREFRMSDHEYIFECEVKKPSKKWMGFLFGMPSRRVSKFTLMCKLRLQKKKFTHLLFDDIYTQLPQGTIFVNAVKLTKLIT